MDNLEFALHFMVFVSSFLAGFGVASRSELKHYRNVERDKLKLKILDATNGSYNGAKFYDKEKDLSKEKDVF